MVLLLDYASPVRFHYPILEVVVLLLDYASPVRFHYPILVADAISSAPLAVLPHDVPSAPDFYSHDAPEIHFHGEYDGGLWHPF